MKNKKVTLDKKQMKTQILHVIQLSTHEKKVLIKAITL